MASATILTDALAAMALFASFSVLLYLTYNYQGPVSTVPSLTMALLTSMSLPRLSRGESRLRGSGAQSSVCA